MLNLGTRRYAKLLACKQAAAEYLALFGPDEIDEAERLLRVETANCAETARRAGRDAAESEPPDVDCLDCPSEGGGAVYCP